MDKRVFLFDDYGQAKQHSVINVEAGEAAKLIKDGKAVELELPEYDELKKQASKLFREYKNKQAKIENSDDPRDTDEVKQYLLDKAYEELKEQTEALQKKWKVKRSELQTEARAKAARATVDVTDSDKQTAEQLANRIQLNVLQTTNPTQLNSVINQASENISFLTDAEKTALQAEIANVVATAERQSEKLGRKVSTRKLITAVQDISDMDLLAGKVADQLPLSVGLEYNQLRLVKEGRPVKTQ